MRGLLTFGLSCLLAAPAAALEAPHYADDTAGSGIHHVYDGGWEYFVGGGLATLDCDSDGRPDLYMAGGTNPATLYRNTSTVGGPLTFQALADPVTDLTDVIGAYPLDVDNDGHQDLMVLRVGENHLLRGRGGCTFEKANDAWAFDGGTAWSTAFTARWGDGDAWPTIAVGNYVDRNAPGAPFGTCHDNRLWHPAPAGGGFAQPQVLAPGYCSLSALFSDWNRDGVPDLRLTNDRQYYRGGQEQLWRVPANGPATAFTRRDGWRKLTIWGMGIASHDVNDDGYPDYFLTSMGDNKLRVLTKGAARPSYGDEAGQRGMTAHRPYTGGSVQPSTAWHSEFVDVNNDGFMDLFIAKGNVEAMPDFAADDPNNLLLGHPDGRFTEVAPQAGIVTFAKARGASLADFNLDGLPDLVVVNRKVPAEVWRNVGRGTAQAPIPMGNWLHLKLRQDGANRDAVGAWVEVRIGTRTLRHEVTVGGGHASGRSGWLHFGTGVAERARVRVQWPGGEWGPWIRLYTNQFALITRGQEHARVWLPPED
ncbi:MAG: CRTAC1 family protein [Rhodobacterales bacterium]|nr:CRTAC1 family protein [Rhodobacterales bacterium]